MIEGLLAAAKIRYNIQRKSWRDNGGDKDACECGNLKRKISISCNDCKLIRLASKAKDKKVGWKLWSWSKNAIAKTPYCQWCYSEDKLEAHHILHKAKFPELMYEESNARVMCKDCHSLCHKQGGY